MNDQHSFFAAFEEKQKRRLAYLSNDFTTADDLKKRAEDVAWYADGSESLCYILREAGMDELKVYLNKAEPAPVTVGYAPDQPLVMNWAMRTKERDRLLPVLERCFEHSGMQLRTHYVRMKWRKAPFDRMNPIPSGLQLTAQADAQAVCDLWKATMDPLSTPIPTLEECRQMMASGELFFLLSGEQPVCVACLEKQGNRATLGHIATHPDFRRRGLSTALLQRVLAGCAEEIIVQLWVDSSNFRALPMYRQLGFEEDGILSYQWLMLPPNA